MTEPTYRESLPQGCPLPDSQPIEEEMIMYRCVNDPPNDSDFASYVTLKKAKGTTPKDICLDYSISLYDCPQKAHNVAIKFGLNIAKILLTEGAGKILQDGKPRKKHYSWWPYSSFDVLNSITEANVQINI